ncbi:MAG: efflux RND transporter periplasmic adaptor subunit [Oligoflexia bacterium]|nr:efflux RND transporter periplasmic adaptor subunit [Oligoflexia bacterium]
MTRQKNRRWIALSPRSKAFLLVFVFGVAMTLLALLRGSRISARREALTRRENAGLVVGTAAVDQSEENRWILLNGETRPYYSVTLFARVSGYLDRLYSDIGDTVRAGQLLAHVESPEAEQAYNSARADAINKRRIAERTRILRARKLISQQQADQAAADADIAAANLRTEGVLRGYQDIAAPFDGVISNRFVDPGALLQNASSSQASSQPLFTLTKADPLRVFVYVDQKDAPYVHPNDPVDIMVPNHPLQTHHAKVDMVAAELDPKTRTLLAEIILANPKGEVVAGSFVSVKMKVQMPPLLKLPSEALVMRGGKTLVAVVQPDGKLHYAPIDLAENDGEHILIRSGVSKGDNVAINIGNTLLDGQIVRETQAAGQVPSGVPSLGGHR